MATKQHSNVWAALLAARADFGVVVKDSTNPHFRNRYASLAAIFDAIDGALAQHGLYVECWPVELETAIGVGMQIHHPASDTATREYTQVLPVAKADPQGHGSAITYARRYLYQTVFGLAAEDDDGNAASQPAKPVTKAAPKPSNGNGPKPPVWADDPASLFAKPDYMFRNPAEAISWAEAAAPHVWRHPEHTANAYAKCKEDGQPQTAAEMSGLWILDVERRIQEASETTPRY